MSTERMSGKERILAALRRQEVDRVPCVPLVVSYSQGAFRDDEPQLIPDIMRAANLDIWHQFMGDKIFSFIPMPDAGIERFTKFDRGEQINGYNTPVGTIYERVRSGIANSLNPQAKHMLETVEDLKVYYYIREHSFPWVVDTSENYNWEMSKIGDDGIIVHMANDMSPFKNFIELLAGVENTYYMMDDDPDLFDATMNLMHEQNKQGYRMMLEQSPQCEVFGSSENISWTTMSPALYEEYTLNQLNDYADIIHEYGKIAAFHMCGKLSLLKGQLAQGKFDAISDISPAPTGDTELWEAAEWWPNIAVKGGIECNEFVADDPKIVYNKCMKILEKTQGRNGVLLGSGDSVPYGVTLEHLRAMRQAADDFAGIK